jgi:hypothetical protein
MEKKQTVSLTWPEILKWIAVICTVISSVVAIKYGVIDNNRRITEQDKRIIILEEQLRAQSIQAAALNEKTSLIYDLLKTINDKITENGLDNRSDSNHR